MMFKLPTQHSFKKGQAVITAVIIFLFISTAVTAAITGPLIKDLQIVHETARSKNTYFLAESLAEDILLRYKKGMSVDSSETLSLNGNTANAVITNTPFGKTVVTSGDVDGAVRRIQVNLIAGIGSSFSYGVQVGTGGFTIENNARVEGNVYSNGNITGSNGALITGTAVAANSAAVTSDQSNMTPTPSPNTITFGNTTATQDIAQSFQLSADGQINKVQLYIRKIGNPGSATVRIVSNSGGSPGTNTVTSGTLASSQVTGSFGLIDVVFPSNPELTGGTPYWLVIDASTNSSNYYILGANTLYANGQAKIGQYAGSWSNTTPSGLDEYFSVFLGGITSTITNIAIGSAGVGDAHAHTVTNTIIAGNLYCATGSGNNKACNTSKPDPSPQGYPISDANIEDWRDEADEGTTISGDYSVDGITTTLGPAHITGNLLVTNHAILTLTGTVWVEGNVEVSQGAIVKLPSSYGSNSAVLITDGRIHLLQGADFQGSGQIGSYILLLTTSDCPDSGSCGGSPAINVENNAGTVILNAQKGTLSFANNAGAKQATAKTIHLEPNAVIAYEIGLTNQNFVSGPGGAFNVIGWKEVE